MSLREQLEHEAAAAAAAVPLLKDDAVTDAHERAARLVGERRASIAAANAADVDAAEGLDPGSLDRLRLDASRIGEREAAAAAAAAG
jgi:gamma-glutamyl phosphate reductase